VPTPGLRPLLLPVSVWALALTGIGCESLPSDQAARLVLGVAGQDTPYVIAIGDSAELEWAILSRDGRDITERYGMSDLVFVPHDPGVAKVGYRYERAHVDAVSTGRTYLELRLPREQLTTCVELTVVP